ncbi:hypothetical protein KEM48_013650 [Puccinia striiformis f. sp. tritici PST-130]|nr:hypothetical protein KEM48_013650 [Puccinia striiformis f. sp. tritici PST-130]
MNKHASGDSDDEGVSEIANVQCLVALRCSQIMCRYFDLKATKENHSMDANRKRLSRAFDSRTACRERLISDVVKLKDEGHRLIDVSRKTWLGPASDAACSESEVTQIAHSQAMDKHIKEARGRAPHGGAIPDNNPWPKEEKKKRKTRKIRASEGRGSVIAYAGTHG